MGILKGALSVRRYRVDGEVPESFRDSYVKALEDNAFRDALSPLHKEERLGWVQIHNLLDTGFADLNQWLYNHYAVFAMRVDKKVLPAKLFKARLEKKVQAWCQENNRERAPHAVKTELKEALEAEMLQQTLPRVQLYECGWNVAEGWVVFHNQSELPNDKFRKLFHRTFGLVLIPFDPIDFVADRGELAEGLVGSGASDLRFEEAV
ncbi:MAG: recombination-associated protein RdgC [Myxococcota bacterium]